MFGLPSIDLQRRLISFVLTRFLGRYFLLDALTTPDLRNGQLVLDDLHVNTKALANLGLPLDIESGHIAQLTLRLSTPVSWSSTLHIALNGVSLDVRLKPGEVVESPLDVEDLAQSMAASLIQDDSPLPGDFYAPVDEEHDQTLIASLIERLLARLSLEIHSAEVTIRTASINARLDLEHLSLSKEDSSRSRSVSLQDLTVALQSTPPSPSSDSDDSLDSVNEMVMSMAIADLRQSSVQESIYHSVYEPPPISTWSNVLRLSSAQIDVRFGTKGWRVEELTAGLGKVQIALWPEHLSQLLSLLDAIPTSTSSSKPAKTPPLLLRLTAEEIAFALVYDAVGQPQDWQDPCSIPASVSLFLRGLDLSHQHQSSLCVDSIEVLELSPHCNKTVLLHFVDPPANGATSRALPPCAHVCKGLEVELAANRTTVKLHPVALFFHLCLLERIQPLLDLLTSLNKTESPASSPADQKELTFSCDFIRVGVQCPSLKRGEGLLEVDLRSDHLEKKGGLIEAGVEALAVAYASEDKEACQFLQLHDLSCSIIQTSTNDAAIIPHAAVSSSNVKVDLNKPTLDGLQFFADDLANLFAASRSTTSSPRLGRSMREASEASMVSRSGSGFELDGNGNGQVKGKTFDLALKLPKGTCRFHTSADTFEGHLTEISADIAARSSPRKNELSAKVCISAIDFTNSTSTTPVLKRMPAPTADMLVLHFISSESASCSKTSKMSVKLDGLILVLPPDLEPLQDLVDLFKSPPGVFENAVPADQTLLVLSIPRLGVEPLSTKLLLEVDGIETQLKLNRKRAKIESTIESLSLWQTNASHEREATWRDESYVCLLRISHPSILATIPSSPRQGVSVIIEKPVVTVDVCQDSLKTLFADIAQLADIKTRQAATEMNDPAASTPPVSEQVKTRLDKSVNLLASLDNFAFETAPRQESADFLAADLVKDDVPADSVFLASKKTKQPMTHTEGKVTMLAPAGLQVVENYLLPSTFDARHPEFSQHGSRSDKLNLAFKEASLSVKLYGGYDWPETRTKVLEDLKARRRNLLRLKSLLDEGQYQANAAEQERLAKEDSSLHQLIDQLEQTMLQDRAQSLAAAPPSTSMESADEDLFGFQDWETLPALSRTPSRTESSSSPAPSARAKRPKTLKRSSHEMLEFAFSKVFFTGRLQNEKAIPTWTADYRAFSFQILDSIPTSTWRKFLTEMRVHEGGYSRASDVPMLRAQLIKAGKDLQIKAKLFPIRLYVDQDAVDFLKRFFASDAASVPKPSGAEEVYVSRLEVFPVKLRLDYKPKHVNYSLLPSSSLELMNFFHFASSDLTLRHITLQGISFSALSDALQDIWTPDVKANQLADVVAGINPVRTVVQLGGGVADLVLLPIEQFKKDGRVLRGVRKGAESFGKKTALESLKLGAKLAGGTQVVFEKAEKVLGANLSSNLVGTVQDDEPEELRSKRAVQPRNAKEGFKEAYDSLSGKLRTTAQTILAVPMEVYESNSQGTVKKVLRAIPVAVFHPAIGATAAVQKTLLGVANTIDKGSSSRRGDKYK